MAANASRSRGLFGRIGGFFGQRYKGAKEVIGGAGSGIKGAYVGVGRAFTGGATLNTVYNNKTNTVVRNMRKIAEVLKELEKHSPGITAEYKKRKKRTLREFITALNSNGGTPRNLKLNAATRTLNHYAENAFLNYQKRKANAGKKNTNNRAKRNANFAKAAANRNKVRRNRQLQSLVNSVLNDTNGNGTTLVTISNANRTEILNTLGAKNMYNTYTKNTGAKTLKGFVAYLNTGRNGNARNLSTLTLLEQAIKNAIANKKSRNEAKTALNANRLAKEKDMRNARRARLMDTPPPPPPPPADVSAGGAVLSAEAATNAAKNAVKIATKNPMPTNNNKAAVAVNAAAAAKLAAKRAVNAARNGNAKLANENALRAGQAAFVARSAVAPPKTTQRQGPNKRVPGKSGAGAASGFLQAVLGA
jgi:hypothetical protein